MTESGAITFYIERNPTNDHIYGRAIRIRGGKSEKDHFQIISPDLHSAAAV